MSIDFCHVGLTSDVRCDKTSFEGHEAENLISNDVLRRQKGFLTSNFVRPPVSVQFKFVCEVDISYIVIRCRVGAQKSSTFEILTQANGASVKSSVGFDSVGETENAIIFHVHGKKPERPSTDSGACATKYCSFKSSKNLQRIKGVDIKIVRTQSSSVPALGRVEIWANPSKSAPHSLINQVKNIWTNITNSGNTEVKKEKKNDNIDVHKPDQPKLFLKDGFEIPEEFIDPISCSVMTIPMTLPSGKVVDITTLDKFHKEEEKWGRSKSDPFTGIVFTDSNKPILAVALKSRLDKFMMDNYDNPQLKDLPRTVGKRPLVACGSRALIPKRNKISESALPSNLDNKSVIKSQFTSNSPECKLNTQGPSSLDRLLSSSLNGLPSYLEKPVVTTESKVECIKCSSTLTLFKLPCDHLLCRSCLVIVKSKFIQNCDKCNCHFNFSDPVRFHTSNFDL